MVTNRENPEGGLGLTSRQLLIWTEQQLAPDIPSNNMLMCFTIDGDIDPDRFACAFESVVDETDALRTVIQDMDGAPRQFVLPNAARLVDFVDLSDGASPERFLAWRDARSVRRFDLDEQLFDCALIRLGDDRSIWYLCQHHLICDAWSFSLIFKRTALFYGNPDAASEAPKARRYRKYLDSQESYRGSDRHTVSAAFWKERFSDPIAPLHPYGVDPAGKRPATRRLSIDLGDVRSERIRALAQQEEMRAATATLSRSMIFTTVLYAYLHRISGNEIVGIGSPVLNRPSRWSKQTVGLFMEVCPFRVEISEDDSFASLHRKAIDENFAVLPHAACSVSNPIRNKRYDAMLNFHNAIFPDFAGQPAQADLRTGPVAMSSRANWEGIDRDVAWDAGEVLTLQVLDFGDTGSFQLHFEFNVDVFDDGTSKHAIEHFLNLLDAMLADPDCTVNAVPMLTPGERKAIASSSCDAERETKGAPSKPFDERPVLERFRDWVARDPDRTALIQDPSIDHGELSYGELDDRVRILSAAIREAGMTRGDRIAVCLTRSAEMLIALLATHDASAAYVPVDPEQPAARIALILEEARPSLVITETSLIDRVETCAAPRILLDPGIWDVAAAPPPAETGHDQRSESESPLAYIIFTSGSTGRPKGVEIEHHALCNFMTSMANRPGLSKKDRLLAITTISFDIAALELFLPLTVGACLEIADEETCRDPARLAERLEASRISLMQATPATWQMLVDSGWQGRSDFRVLCGGDALSRELANALLDRAREVWNLYGPTETTIWSSVERITPGTENVCIGQPIDRTSLRILTSGLQGVPKGVPGELFIGGDGLARGYCRQPELTAARFVLTPESPDERFYRTGDRVRQLPDGRIECLGRVDFQVKIRGFRIEAGEIEAALRRLDELTDAVVVARGADARDRHLVAYLVPQNDAQPVIETLSAALRSSLPSYMIPTRWIIVERLPLTGNGKIDRKKVAGLPGHEVQAVGHREAPRNDTEVQIAEVWRELLGVSEIGRDDDFFDLGGHSLLAVEGLARIERRLGRRTPLAAFFERPTVAGVSDSLRSDGGDTHVAAAVELRAGTSEMPLFCIGGIHLYQALAREMTPGLRVFGVFLAQETDWLAALQRGRKPKLASTEDSAAQYIEVIKRHQPQGPYRLAGLSYGGVLAYEMARQLTNAGERVEALILFDVRLYGVVARAGGFFSRFRLRLRGLRADWAAANFSENSRRSSAPLRDRLFIQAIRDYEGRIAPYDGSVLLCVAKDNDPSDANADPSFGWAGLVRGDLTIVECPGDHVGLVAGDYAAQTASTVEAFLTSHASRRRES